MKILTQEFKASLTNTKSKPSKVDLRILELQTAKEILAEIFSVRISDVEEMIQNRYEEPCYGNNSYEETEQWPQEFVLGESSS